MKNDDRDARQGVPAFIKNAVDDIIFKYQSALDALSHGHPDGVIIWKSEEEWECSCGKTNS